LTIKIYDTLTRKKRDFEPLEEGKVGMYVCGITVQDRPHVGHIRSVVVNDTIRRYLEHRGYEVTFVWNFTDVDDKILERAREEGIEYSEVAQRNIDAYYRVADALAVKRPTVTPRATEHIQEILDLIRRLEEREFAYPAGGDVYYDVRRKKDYGKLSRRAVDEMRSGARIEVGEEKRDPLDFALWKGAKEGEVFWESPYGPGRPGWHIECSAMSMKYLGETFDIHGGGQDLVFPHHENEIAQSEAATGKSFARNWVHHGMVNLGGEKMSKSEKRFSLAEDILEEIDPEVVRFYLLSTHYRSPIEFSTERLREAQVALDRIRQPLERYGGYDDSPGSGPAGEMAEAVAEVENQFHEAMDDDFNTAKALGHLFELARAVNRMGEGGDAVQATAGARALVRLGNVLGVFTRGPRATEEWSPEILALVEQREEARKTRDWGRADSLRDELLTLGVVIEDSPQGPRLKKK
jgi:cysteinyl-tRNA synthetase